MKDHALALSSSSSKVMTNGLHSGTVVHTHFTYKICFNRSFSPQTVVISHLSSSKDHSIDRIHCSSGTAVRSEVDEWRGG